MIRKILLTLGSLTAIISVYVLLVVLEYLWNWFAWRPYLDTVVLGVLATLVLALAGSFLCVRASRDRVSGILSLLAAIALLLIGLRTLAAEPVTTGMFARNEGSPLCYRAGRLIVTALPLIFWLGFRLRRRARPAAGS